MKAEVESLLASYLNQPTPEQLVELTEEDLVFWVDWKEDDEDIVDDIASRLDGDELFAETIDADSSRGYDMVLRYNDHDTIVSYDEKEAERDLTLQAIGEAVDDDYSLRFCRYSVGGDTLAFIVLPNEDWKQLEEEHGVARVEQLFETVGEGSRMFGLSFNEIDEILEEIGAE